MAGDAPDERSGPLAPEDITADSPFTLPGFFAAMADGRLLAARCIDCDARLIPPRPACYDCGSRAVGVEEQPRTGTVLSYTAVHRPPSPFEALAPFTVAVVELDSGARLTGRLTSDYEETAIGDRVELAFVDPDEAGIDPSAFLSYEEDWPIHVFEPAR